MQTRKAISLTFLIATAACLAPSVCGYKKLWAIDGNLSTQRSAISAVLVHRKRGKVIELKIQDSGRTLNLATQQTIRISLAENPTTGYRWHVVENGSPVLQLSSDNFQRGSSTGVGAGGTRVFDFHSESAGTGNLHLSYARASDPASQKNEFVLHVQVTAP